MGTVNFGGEEERWIKDYSSSQSILLVGEGDFSFSACLASAFGSAHKMVATSLDSYYTLIVNYKNAISNVSELQGRGCIVLDGVDATRMTEESCIRFQRFDRIIFNFPYASRISGDSRVNQLRSDQKLVMSFLKNARQLLEVNGEVHITHKTNGFHSEWNLDVLGILSGLRVIEEVDFSLGDYPGYSNKNGDGGIRGDQSFNCYPSKTYKFSL